jgi:hypothetical protein
VRLWQYTGLEYVLAKMLVWWWWYVVLVVCVCGGGDGVGDVGVRPSTFCCVFKRVTQREESKPSTNETSMDPAL